MMNFVSLENWLSYIKRLHVKSIDLGLSRVRDIAIELNLLHPAEIVVLVGGTNGKGTTCCLLESILLDCGFSVGVYSSPHLLSYTERLRINGKELKESQHVEAMIVIESVRFIRSLTYFEFVTLSSLYLLKNQSLDVVLLEVGLGGRLDATNIVIPDISIVTNVAIDHIDLLGSDYIGIAKEKFGIFRLGKPAIVGDFRYPKILKSIIHNWYGAVPFVKNQDWWFYVEGNKWYWWSDDCKLESLICPNVPVENAAIVLAAIRFFPFNIPRKSIDYALNTATLPGRFQIIERNPIIVLDVAHNPHAALYLSKRLKTINISGRFRIVVGMLCNKNIFGTLHRLDDLMPIWYCFSLDCFLGASSLYVSHCIGNVGIVKQFGNVYDAFYQAVLDSCYGDCVVVFGSFYAVAPILQLINKKVNYSE